MLYLCVVLLLTGVYPLWRAWRANRDTTLRQAVLWACGAWATWLLVLVPRAADPAADLTLGRHVALSLTGCAGIAVLGARRPGVGAWNFVVCGLLAVLMLPVAEGMGTPRLDSPYLIFLAATLAVGLLNYLPTRLGPAAFLVMAGCGLLLYRQIRADAAGWVEAAGSLCLAAGPWIGLGLLQGERRAEEIDQIWLDFRDRYGAVWSLRVREQFNRATANANWPVVLTWQGLTTRRGGTPPERDKITATLRALLKRFTTEADEQF